MSKLLLLSVNEDDIIDQILAFLDHGNRIYNLAEHTMEKKAYIRWNCYRYYTPFCI